MNVRKTIAFSARSWVLSHFVPFEMEIDHGLIERLQRLLCLTAKPPLHPPRTCETEVSTMRSAFWTSLGYTGSQSRNRPFFATQNRIGFVPCPNQARIANIDWAVCRRQEARFRDSRPSVGRLVPLASTAFLLIRAFLNSPVDALPTSFRAWTRNPEATSKRCRVCGAVTALDVRAGISNEAQMSSLGWHHRAIPWGLSQKSR